MSTAPYKPEHSIPERFWYGKTGERRSDGRCSECGASGFAYSNGAEISEDGVRGYRCMSCCTIKPEREPTE